MDTSIHYVKKIEADKIDTIMTTKKTHYRHITIETEKNEILRIVLFADNKKDLEIIKK